MGERRILYAVAYASTGAKQSAFGTPTANGTINTLLNLTEGRSQIEVVETTKEVLDCLGREQLDEIGLTRLCRLNVEFKVDEKSIAVLGAYAAGVAAAPTGAGPFTHAITRLAERLFVLPYFTLICGFADGVDPGVKVQDCIVNSFGVNAPSQTDDILCNVEIVGKGDLAAAAAYTFPDCSDYTPLSMVAGALTLDGENLLSGADANHTAYSAQFTMSNNILVGDHPFPLAALDIKRLEQGDRRIQDFTLNVGGRLNDTLHAKMKARQHAVALWRIGASPAAFTVNIPDGIIRPTGPAHTTWVTEASESALQISVLPAIIPGDATTPFNFSAINAVSTTYLS